MILARIKLFAVAAVAVLTLTSALAAEQSSSSIKKAIITQSIASYPGNCPCPYNSASNGSSCGKRSAYSRPGGYSPICYEHDVTPSMIQDYKQNDQQ